MKMFVVLFFDGYSYYFDENARYFTSWTAAFDYRQKLNLQLAKENHCFTKDLGEWYEMEEIFEGK